MVSSHDTGSLCKHGWGWGDNLRGRNKVEKNIHIYARSNTRGNAEHDPGEVEGERIGSTEGNIGGKKKKKIFYDPL